MSRVVQLSVQILIFGRTDRAQVEKFVGPQHLNPLHYTGPPAERQRLRQRLALHNLVVASYDIVRNDVDFFADQRWNYCVLDEVSFLADCLAFVFPSRKKKTCYSQPLDIH